MHFIEGNPLLSGTAMRGVRLWKLSPATLNGEPIKSLNRVRFTFRIPDNSYLKRLRVSVQQVTF